MAGTTISFDGHSLQTSTILTQVISHNNPPTKNAQISQLSHSNKSVIPFVSYPDKTITISGVITAASNAALEGSVDTFKSYFNNSDAYLDIGYNSGTRRYIATVNSSKIDQPGGLSYATFQIEFICTQPFGVDTSATTAINTTGNTTNYYAPTYTFLGSAPVQSPVITITFSAMTGNTNAQTVYVGNYGTSQIIAVNRIWSATDVLVVDTVNESVQVNGSDVDFNGAFPRFIPGAGMFQYYDTLTTRTFAFNAIYNVRYM